MPEQPAAEPAAVFRTGRIPTGGIVVHVPSSCAWLDFFCPTCAREWPGAPRPLHVVSFATRPGATSTVSRCAVCRTWWVLRYRQHGEERIA